MKRGEDLARNKLSETRIRTFSKPGVYGDGDGLWLRVFAGGSRSWVFIYRRGDQRNEIGLGGHGQGTAPVSLSFAREKAEEIRQQLARGRDPRPSRAKAKTFGDCMEALIATKEGDWTNKKHGDQWKMTLREYAKPLHGMAVADVVMGDVKVVLLEHWTDRPETADRLRSRIQAVFDYAIAHEYRTAGNPARWKGLLDAVMPKRQGLIRGHRAALAYRDAPILMAGLRQSKGVSARAVEFLTLTAARTGEVRGLSFREIDFEAKTWTCPPERMKAGKEHVVPLTSRALEIVEDMRAVATTDLLFPVSDTALTKALRLASPDKKATLHGWRSMFRDWAGDMTNHPREVAEAALAHTVGNAVEAAYRRGSALEKRRQLMFEWQHFLVSTGPDAKP